MRGASKLSFISACRDRKRRLNLQGNSLPCLSRRLLFSPPVLRRWLGTPARNPTFHQTATSTCPPIGFRSSPQLNPPPPLPGVGKKRSYRGVAWPSDPRQRGGGEGGGGAAWRLRPPETLFSQPPTLPRDRRLPPSTQPRGASSGWRGVGGVGSNAVSLLSSPSVCPSVRRSVCPARRLPLASCGEVTGA